ncbi:hypothetical protein WR25_11792 [Diploscapter pachys]|uniref:Transmembrane protein 254 n=1 Tax=Diploscapter pachys TaxID=2018661 RepID=A0A2A2J9A9_9BILA|nr:hypothetical protein WR25_11792 [Diploscapter pachys]
MDGTFFRVPKWYWWVIIPFGLWINFMAWWNPMFLKTSPCLPVIGKTAAWIAETFPMFVIFANIIAVILHVGEAAYAYKLTGDAGLNDDTRKKWTLQTFIIGFPSLKMLKEYSKTKQKKS